MSFPNVTGITSLLHVEHREWTPIAIKLVLMTSSVLFDQYKHLICDSITSVPTNAFSIGVGHVNLDVALDLGLVYDLGFDEYVSFLCSLNYTKNKFILLQGKRFPVPT